MSKKTAVAVTALLAIYCAAAFSSIRHNSPTCDELAHHIPAGAVFLKKGDLKMDPSHPPLSRYLVALPLVLAGKANLPDNPVEWRRKDRSEFGKIFFYHYNADATAMIRLSRSVVILVGLLGGFILFNWAKEMWGEARALFALFLYSFSPNILAHARLATTDMIFTASVILALYAMWRYACHPCGARLVAAGIALGLVQLAKYSGLLLYPVFLSVLLVKKSLWRGLMGIICISILILWAGYGFDTKPLLQGALDSQEKLKYVHHLGKKHIVGWNEKLESGADTFLTKQPFPLGTYVLGLAGLFRHTSEGHTSFLLGQKLLHGSPWYYFVAFFNKTPIPLLAFLITGTVLWRKEKDRLKKLLILLPIALFFIAGTISKLQLGLRYILPVYPLCFLVASQVLTAAKTVRIKAFLAVLSLWYVLSSLWIWPHYLSYFNEIAGGPNNGHKILRDSDLDWGQDLPALADWVRENNVSRIKLLYFGTADPGYYGIHYEVFDSKEEMVKPASDVYAISAQYIDTAEWTKKHAPTARAGYSIFIYDFRKN